MQGLHAAPQLHVRCQKNMKSRSDIVIEGSEILKPLMSKNGFQFTLDGEGQSSGGQFAFGPWTKNDRKLEYHFRFSLGLVEYSLENKTIEHGFFLWALTGEKRKAKFPGSSEDPTNGFSRLLDDLSNFCGIFLNGTDSELRKTMEKAKEIKVYWESLSPLKRIEIK